MAQLNLEFVGLRSLEGHVTVDGKFVKLKKVNQKYVCHMTTNQPQAEFVIYQSHPYTGKHWLLWNLFYFIVSLFGLFDVRYNKRCLVQDACLKIDVSQDANVVIRRENFVTVVLLYEPKPLHKLKPSAINSTTTKSAKSAHPL